MGCTGWAVRRLAAGWCVLLLLPFGCRVPRGDQTERREPLPPDKLDRVVALELKGASFLDAVKQLEQLGGVPIFLDAHAAATQRTVTLPRMQVEVGHAVSWLARYEGLQAREHHGLLLLTRPQDASALPVPRVYDVSDLFATRVQRGLEPRDTEASGAGLARFVQHVVTPRSVGDASTGLGAPFVAHTGGRLFALQTEEAQRQVTPLLDGLRKDRNLQVHILARLIEISGDCFEPLKLTFRPAARREERAAGRRGRSREAALAYAPLTEDQVRTLMQAILKQRRGTLIAAPRLTCFNRQRANLQVLTNYSYVPRVTTDDEPEIGNIPEGLIFDVQPFVHPDHRRITLVVHSRLCMFHVTESGHKAVEYNSPTAVVTVADGGTALLAGPALDAQLGEAKGKRQLVILVSAEIVPDIFEDE